MCSQFVLDPHARACGALQPAARLEQPAVAHRPRTWCGRVSVLRAGCATSSSARCRGNDALDGPRRRPADAAFMARHGGWRGPYEEGTLFFYIDEYIKDAPKDLLRCSAATADWLDRSTEEGVDAGREEHRRAGRPAAAQPAERALLLYGTLARYQRDLRGLLVEFKVSNAQRGLCGHRRRWRASTQARWPRRCAPARGSSASGMVENLISEHNITDLADLDEGQRAAAARADARVPAAVNDLMAVFTRPAAQRPHAGTTSTSWATTSRCSPRCCATRVSRARARASTCCCTARRAPARPSWPRWPRRPPASSSTKWNTPTATATRLSGRDRYRSLQISQVFLKGSPHGGAAVRRGGGRLPAHLDRRRAADGAARHRRRHALGQRQRQGLGEPDPRDQPGAGDLGHQPHRADRPRVPPPLPVPPRPEVAAARRARGAGDARAPGRAGVRRLRGTPGRAARPHARAGAHGGQVRAADGRRARRAAPWKQLIERQLGNADKALGFGQRPRRAARRSPRYDLSTAQHRDRASRCRASSRR